MSITNPKTSDGVDLALSVIETLFKDYQPRDFAVRLWDGTIWNSDPGIPLRFTLVLRHAGALRKMLLPPSDLTLGEAFIYGDFDIEGDIESVFDVGYKIINQKRGVFQYLALAAKLLRLPSGQPPITTATDRGAANLMGVEHSKERDRQAITYHYDVSNDFYALWLDQRMVYSCAYFKTPDDDIDTAQEQKLDYICRKLRLKAGESLLDIGCGWGGLIIHAAKNYGVEAVGITLSQSQAELANERIQWEGLQKQCRVEVCDYRDLDTARQFDKLVSVGMFEHVGSKLLKQYFDRAWQMLRPGGVFLNHGIADDVNSTGKTSPFINRYVFPDGEVIRINTTLRLAEQAGFEVRDVENLREHYTLTLSQWVQRLNQNEAAGLDMVGTVAYRVWQLYMAGARYGFVNRLQTLFQVLLSKPDNNDARLPLTRTDWYEAEEPRL